MHGPSTRRAPRLESIDGLRAVAALAVFAYHLTWRSPTLRYGHGAGLTGHFDTGVEVFFVISGFLIFGPFASALVDRERLPPTRPYAARRLVRIWPAYLVVLCLTLLLGIVEVNGPRGFAKHATLSYLYFGDRGGRPLPVAWTLVVEASFYIAVPLLARLFVPVRRHLPEVLLGMALVGAWFQHVCAYDLHTEPWVRVLPPALLSLSLGMLLSSVRAQGAEARGLGRVVRAVARRPVVPLTMAGAAFAVMALRIHATPDIAAHPQDRFAKELLQAVVAVGLAMPVLFVIGEPGRWRRVLAHPVMAYLGTVSYGIYLWHLPVLHKCRSLLVSDHPLVAVAGWAIALGITVGLASISWFCIERPALALVRSRLAARRPLAEAAAP